MKKYVIALTPVFLAVIIYLFYLSYTKFELSKDLVLWHEMDDEIGMYTYKGKDINPLSKYLLVYLGNKVGDDGATVYNLDSIGGFLKYHIKYKAVLDIFHEEIHLLEKCNNSIQHNKNYDYLNWYFNFTKNPIRANVKIPESCSKLLDDVDWEPGSPI